MVSNQLDIIKFLLIYKHLQSTYWFKREAQAKAKRAQANAERAQADAERAKAEGEKAKALATARDMIADNMPINIIVKYTGLTEGEIKSLLQ